MDEASIFQVIDLFPIPIEIFRPDGVSRFVNRAFLECFQIPDPAMIVGKLNIIKDPYANQALGLTESLKHIFAGEILTISNIRVPFEEINNRYGPDKTGFTAKDMYQNIISFPIRDQLGALAYVAILFITKHLYQSQQNILKSKEYIENHWLETFDAGKTAAAAGISRYHFTRLFKKYTGMTPYGYYQDIKIKQLMAALGNRRLSITEAFSSCGVDYNGSFAKIFKAKTGMTPSQYRKSLNKSPLIKPADRPDSTPPRPALPVKLETLFQVLELFPFPIKIFNTQGDVIFVNQMLLEMWNISEPAQIVGKYNLKRDPVVNEQLGLSESVRRTFAGEIVLVPDVKVPLADFSVWYEPRTTDYPIESMYTDILNFPLYDNNGRITHVTTVFLTTRIYQGMSEITKAREYLENHWLEEFNMDRLAQAVHVSRYHFARLFKKHTGTTPYGYYQNLKVEKLKEALHNKNLSIAEAFASCGLAYHGHYAGIFKEKVGMSPSQYRKHACQPPQ